MSESNKPIIEMRGICKYFPGVKALDGVDLVVYPGEVHALMGENGAGKSTLIKVIAGVHKPDGGSYSFNGVANVIKSPADAIHSGISVVYQELNLVNELSVAENIYFGNYPKTKHKLVDWNKLNGDAAKILNDMQADIDPRMKVGYLPVGKQQLVEIAKSIAKNPKVLIMDEPTSALSMKEIEHLYGIIRNLKKKGVAIIYVSHKLDEIYAVTDQITTLRDGKYIGSGRTSDISESELIHMMVGHDVQNINKRISRGTKQVVLKVDNLSTDHVRNISFHINKGEIVGFAGLMGAGRTELAKGIIGYDERITGEVQILGQPIKKNDTSAAINAGIGFVPEDRKKAGIIAGQTVGFNISISSLRQLSSNNIISKSEEKTEIDEQIKELEIKTSSGNVKVETLSGGNQQKVILARWLMNKKLNLLIIDEPTRGIDIGAKAEIYEILDQLTRKGVSIMLISSEMSEIVNLCDRIYVMRNGRISGELNEKESQIKQESILKLAI